MSGAWADVHGQATNYDPRPLRVEHVFGLARAQGLPTALAAGPKAQQLFAPHVQKAATLAEGAETAPLEDYLAVLASQAEEDARLLQASTRGLTVLEIHVVDDAGHGWGSASEEYARAAALADDAVRRLASGLDLGRATLVVTGDHGHVAEGGHGGPEPEVMGVPLVMAGAGVRAGARGDCLQVDVAPTLSALLGLPLPAASRGRALVEALAIADAARLDWLRATVEQRRAFAERYRAWLSGNGVAPATFSASARDEPMLWRTLEDGEREMAEAREARQEHERRGRLPWALALAVPPLLVLGGLRAAGAIHGRELLLAGGAAVAGVALYHGLLPVAGLRYSLTAVNKDEWLAAYFRRDMALSLAAAAVAVAGALGFARRRWGAGVRTLGRVAWTTAAAFAGLLLLKVAFVYWRHAVIVDWHLPDQYRAFGFYLDVLALMAVGLAGPLFALVAWPVSRLVAPTAASPPR
jgi:hypothetical protein